MNRPARTAGISLAASLATHGVLFLVVAWVLTVGPVIMKIFGGTPQPKPSPKPRPAELVELDKAAVMEINFVDLLAQLQREKAEAAKPPEERTAIAAAPPPKKAPVFVPSRDGQEEKTPFTRDTSIFSDKNSRASATNAPEQGGDPSLPSQMGHDIPVLSLTHSDFAAGGDGSPASPAPTPEPEPPAVAQNQPPPAPTPRPPDPANALKTDSPDSPAPAPEKQPEIALRDSVLMEDQVKLPADMPPAPAGMKRPSPQRPPAPTPKPFPPPRDPVNTTAARTAPGGRRSLSSVKTRVKGGLAVKGDDDDVDALATPEGRYAKAVRDVIGPLWNARLAGVSGLAGSGVVEVSFDIDAQGRVSNVRLTNPDTASAILNDVCLTAITNAKLPAPPDELRKELADPLTGGKLRRTFTFYRL